jgi:hypothetical protein
MQLPVPKSRYFGQLPKWAVLDMSQVRQFQKIPVPVGLRCYYCPEYFRDGDSGFAMTTATFAHAHCYQLAFLGALQAVGREMN